jgi:hypothetical protein
LLVFNKKDFYQTVLGNSNSQSYWSITKPNLRVGNKSDVPCTQPTLPQILLIWYEILSLTCVSVFILVFFNKTHSLTHGAEPFLRSRQLCSHSRTSKHFVEPESSLPCSQEPSTGPYPEPDQSNPYHPIHPISLRSFLIFLYSKYTVYNATIIFK